MPIHASVRLTVAALLLLGGQACAAGQAGSEGGDARAFFAGRTLTYIVATDPGGAYDTYGRLIARHLQRHLGLRAAVVRNVPGGGHVRGAHEIAAARPDGLTIGTFNTGLLYSQLFGHEGLRLDLGSLSWIGKAGGEPRVLILSSQSGLRSIHDVRRLGRPLLMASSGHGSEGYHDAILLAHALGYQVRFVFGLPARAAQLSMLRGEIEGVIGTSSAHQTFIENGYGTVALRISQADAVDRGVPGAHELAEDPDAQGIVDLVTAVGSLMRWTAGPPGIPAERLAVLRDAYAAALSDPLLLADAHSLGIPIVPMAGARLERAVRQVLGYPPEEIARIASLVAAHGTH